MKEEHDEKLRVDAKVRLLRRAGEGWIERHEACSGVKRKARAKASRAAAASDGAIEPPSKRLHIRQRTLVDDGEAESGG